MHDGTSDAVLDLAAGRIEDTALPGTPGNVGIAAHRDGFFRALKDIKEGDELVLETPVATEQYRVEWIKITVPTDVSVIDATPGPAVTLVGCYPFYHVGPAPQRFIVRAVPATASPATAVARGQLTRPRCNAPRLVVSASCDAATVARSGAPALRSPSPTLSTRTRAVCRPNSFAASQSAMKMSISRPFTSRPVSSTS